MKNLIYLISCILFFGNCKNKNPEKPFEEKTDFNSCEYGKSDAESDFKKGNLMLYIYGMPGPSSSEYWKILDKEYHISVKGAIGCVITEGVKCYNDFMNEKIIEKYGKDIFEYASYKGDSIYYANCEAAKKIAKEDFKKGKLMLFERNENSNEFYWQILTSKYHISKNTSKVLSQNNSYQCYNDFMEEKITEKYGENVFTEIRNQQDSLETLDCEDAVSIAKLNYKSNGMMLTDGFYNFFTNDDLWKILDKNFNIHHKSNKDFRRKKDNECYNRFMFEKIGENLGKKIRLLTDSLYEIACDKIKIEVEKEVKNNQYYLIEFEEAKYMENFWKELEKYNIHKKIASYPYSSNNIDRCYHDFMIEKIKEKYGEDFLKEIYKKIITN